LNGWGRLCQQLGYMPQNFIFDPAFPSLWELVGLGWVKHRSMIALGRRHQLKGKTSSNRASSASECLPSAAKRSAPSAGELKRLLLAYCLVMPRKLLVLDEAFAVWMCRRDGFYTC